ncbi:hypothetical protein [Streptomyces orinoci]|uniref:Uncharacterized protein n=1 Tax=Streptomyces orinoci TaxID=67339 RepID=A0ABV3JUA6_STRON|nr:hypothetical protein [Streptomyces orinoci]
MADDNSTSVERGWPDEDSAERLLAGQPLAPCPACDGADRGGAAYDGSALDGSARVRCGCVAGALEAALTALRSPAPLPDGPLPGEEAALAAFRAARSGQAVCELPETERAMSQSPAGEPSVPGRPVGERPAGQGRAAEVAPLAPGRRPRLRRPARVAMVVAVAGCALSGVAVAAGVVDLPAALGGSRHKSPAGVAVEEPDQTSAAPAPQESGAHPGGTPHGTARPDRPSPGRNRPSTGSSGTPGDRSAGPSAGPSATPPRQDGQDQPAPDSQPTRIPHDWLVRVCRDYLVPGNLLGRNDPALRALERTAGGTDRVRGYCQDLLRGEPSGDQGSQGQNSQGQDSQGQSSQGQDNSVLPRAGGLLGLPAQQGVTHSGGLTL